MTLDKQLFKSNQLYWLTNNGTVKHLKPCKKSIIKEAIKDGRGRGTAMQRPANAWKCLAMWHWQCVQRDCSTVREALRSRLLFSGVNGTYDDVFWRYVLVRSTLLRPPLAGSQCVRGWCRMREWGLREDGAAQEKKDLFDEVVLYMAVTSCFWPYDLPGAVCAPSGRCLVESMVTVPLSREYGQVHTSVDRRSCVPTSRSVTWSQLNISCVHA